MKALLLLRRIKTRHGGATLSLLRTLDGLEALGWECRAATPESGASGPVRGRFVERGTVAAQCRWADVVLTSPGFVRDVPMLGKRPRIAAFVHSDVTPGWAPDPASAPDLVVYASSALQSWARTVGRAPACPEVVFWPPLDPEAYRTMPGHAVTLVNMQREKGADLFWALAARMPDVRFVAVMGGWGLKSQVVPSRTPANVSVLPYQPDPREVYRRTAVVLYPRMRPGAGPMRGLGLVPLEAAISGIPSIVNPGPGPREAMGDAGVWVEGHDPAVWDERIRWVLRPDVYRELSRAALERAAAVLRPSEDLARLDAALRAVV